ncbi:hypothetical protein EBL89_07640 [Cereibacter sphaeroides]|uniref:hypothetical protein n=1 Tax=Cereibacter sphaeroides TaxID=1063 RepID=UPI000F5445DE|nr:hypothetical protein [Cereibacter sphaeroides]AZB55187.1 hypothetical protein EBL89_07640 [Cereibacter sphaeroides]AZB59443.1 hypothetical protein EBL88_07570 [Cereibacter sphaeroides]
MTSRASSRLLFSLGLALPLGLFGAGLARLLDRPPVSLLPPAPVEEAGPRRPEGPLTYLPLPAPIHATIRGGRRQLTIQASFAVETGQIGLAEMASMLKTDLPLLTVELAEALRACDEAQPSLDAFRRALPDALRAAANARYGTPEAPEPVFEALLTDFLVN